MVCKIFKDGEIIDFIVADENFCKEYCAKNGYTYELELPNEPGMRLSSDSNPTEIEKLRADIDYLAAMAGVTL